MYQYPKSILSIEDQIQTYLDSGMQISSREEAKCALERIGYYRLRGYFFQWYDKNTKKYTEGTRFEDVLRLYEFDRKLSNRLFAMIANIEVALRARLSQALLIHGDALIIYDPSIFKNKQHYWSNMASVASEIVRSKDAFIKHDFEKYEGGIPVWAVVEVLSFGVLSKIIKNLKYGANTSFDELAKQYRYQTKKGNWVSPSGQMLSSWIQSVSTLRNICAHSGRIYSRAIDTRPRILDEDKIESNPKYSGLYQILLAMKYLRPSDEEWRSFVQELETLLREYADVIVLSAMNIPDNWTEYLCIKTDAECIS